MRTGETIAIEFNDFSKNYTADMIRCVPHYESLLASFTEHFPDNFKATSILDLGCGNGNVTAQLLPHFPNAKYTLVDASAEMIRLCQHQFNAYDCVYANTYFKDFLFEEDKYDVIVAGFSLHHCDENEKQALFPQLYTSLKKGGIFSCTDLMMSKSSPNHPALLEEWEAFVQANFPNGEKWTWLMEHYEAFDTPTDYTKQVAWLKTAGFNTIAFPFKKGSWMHLQAVK